MNASTNSKLHLSPVRDTLNPPRRTPNFRVVHPITGHEFVLHVARTRIGGTIHAVFAPDSPTAPGVRRVIHSKRRGYFDFLQAALALLALTRWHDPRPYLPRLRDQPVQANPNHYPEWDTDHPDYPQRPHHIGVIVLYVEQLADPSYGRGRRLVDTLDTARIAQQELQTTGLVTAHTRARANLRADMLREVTKALQVIAPHYLRFKQEYRAPRKGPTALGYTHDEIEHLRQLWTAAHFALTQIQIRVRDNALHAREEAPPIPVQLPAAGGEGFRFALDEDMT